MHSADDLLDGLFLTIRAEWEHDLKINFSDDINDTTVHWDNVLILPIKLTSS